MGAGNPPTRIHTGDCYAAAKRRRPCPRVPQKWRRPSPRKSPLTCTNAMLI
nr:hypothetical protein [Streptomyces brasiliensis]